MERRQFLALASAGAAVPMLLAPKPATAVPVPETIPATVENPSTITPAYEFLGDDTPSELEQAIEAADKLPPELEEKLNAAIESLRRETQVQAVSLWQALRNGAWRVHDPDVRRTYWLALDGDRHWHHTYSESQQLMIPALIVPAYGYVENWDSLMQKVPWKAPTYHRMLPITAGHIYERVRRVWLPRSGAFRRLGRIIWGELDMLEVRYPGGKLEKVLKVVRETVVEDLPNRHLPNHAMVTLGIPADDSRLQG